LDVPIDDIPVQGRDLITGKPKEIMVNYKEIAKALDKSIIRIEDAVMETFLYSSGIGCDIYKTGIYLAGGGALLRGLADRLQKNGTSCIRCRRSVESGCSRNRYCS
jgi:rod shape-determining protein MreB